jgi:hypothetical protein
MKKAITLPVVFFSFIVFLIPAGKIIQLGQPAAYHDVLDNNNVFLKRCLSFDVYKEHFYFLDSHYCHVMKVEVNTGNLIRTISSKGQGPRELQRPLKIRVKNDKIFILDAAFNGIKIFDLEGKLIKEFKLTMILGHSYFDVTKSDEIVLARFDLSTKKFLTVFSLEGKKQRTLIQYNGKRSMNPLNPDWYYIVRLDNKGNSYLLFFLSSRLDKYNKEGKRLWSIPIENEILDTLPQTAKLNKDANKTIHHSRSIFSLEITEKNNAVVGHVGGGCLISPVGEYLATIYPDRRSNIFETKIFKNRLVNLLVFGHYIYVYDFKED